MKFNIAAATEENTVEWMNWYEGVKEVGDTFEMALTKVSFNADKNAIYLIGEEQATTVYTEHHEASKFKNSTTHGIRVVNAFARKLDLDGEIEATTLFEGIVTLMSENDLTIKAEKTVKGVLWSVA